MISISSEIRIQLRDDVMQLVSAAKTAAKQLDNEQQQSVISSCKDVVSCFKNFAATIEEDAKISVQETSSDCRTTFAQHVYQFAKLLQSVKLPQTDSSNCVTIVKALLKTVNTIKKLQEQNNPEQQNDSFIAIPEIEKPNTEIDDRRQKLENERKRLEVERKKIRGRKKSNF